MKPIDLPKLTRPELRNMLENARRLGRQDMVDDVVREMSARGWAQSRDYDALEWNPARVKESLAPFARLARGVRENQRTSYTEAGGRRIGRGQNDPDRVWIDTYSAIKTPKLNAVMVCYVKMPGEMPWLELHLNGESIERYGADEWDRALEDWQRIAAEAA